VLDSVGGDQDQAIDALLGMSDPNYQSERRPEEPRAQPLVSCSCYYGNNSTLDIPYFQSQTELDEEFARRLMLEDQERQQQAWIAQQPAQYPQRQTQRTNQQPSPGAATPPSGGGDTMGQQFSKIAECEFQTRQKIYHLDDPYLTAGKKTIGSIFSKVKAKIQEFDQPKFVPSDLK
jgi:hypothetical protein